MADYETCRAALEDLLRDPINAHTDRNEANTRFQLIDRLFIQCLGWSHVDVDLEEAQGREYADYVFKVGPERQSVLIVEAKREGQYFEVPAGKTGLHYSLASLQRDSEELNNAIRQALGYCQSRGVPFAAVANGHQVVAFLASRSDGVPPLNGQALIFSSLGHMYDHFYELWQALSRPGIESRNLLSLLARDHRPELPPKLSSTISNYPGLKRRNPFQADLQILSELVLEDLENTGELEEHFLRDCYCASGALSQYALTSKHILQARYAALYDTTSPGPPTTPVADRQEISPQLLADSLSRRPILLIGDVGVGKTTFTRYLVKIAAAEQFEHSIAIFLDLGTQATLTESLRDFTLTEIERQLLDTYDIDIHEHAFVRAVYKPELQRFQKGIYAQLLESDPKEYLSHELRRLTELIDRRQDHIMRSLQHVSGSWHRTVVLFIDNCDQRTDSVQQEAFLIAQEIAERWPVTVFLALRPPTFYRSSKQGALTGYHPKAFTVAPPRIDRVIERRLHFALGICSGQIPSSAVSDKTRMELQSLRTLIYLFLESLERDDRLYEFIDNVCAGNVRQALGIVRNFFGSGHVDTQKWLIRLEETGTYYVPPHEFVRAVIYGDSEYYDPERSPLCNLFDLSRPDPREHFLLPMIVAELNAMQGIGTQEGFVEQARIFDLFQRSGFVPEQVHFAVARGIRSNVLEGSGRWVPEDEEQGLPGAVRPTAKGLYHVVRLCHMFTYLDAVVVDTPILDPDLRSEIRNVSHIDERLVRAELFRKYLDNLWLPFSGSASAFSWQDASEDVGREIDRIRDRRPRREVNARV